jgi:hypothetical protein
LEPFLKVTGDNRSARELYAELMGDHGRAIELLEKDAREATRAFNEVGEQLRERMREAERRGVESKYETMNPTPAEIALFLIFSADPRVNDRPRHIAFHYMLVLNPKMKAALTEGTFAAPMRKLFVNWLVNDTSTYFRQFGFTLAADVKLLDFAPAMVQLIEAKDSSAKIRALAMVSLLKSGSEGEVKVLSRYLTDQTEVCADLPPVNGQRIKTQLRDVAMGISLQLAGQHPRDYGWTDERFGPGVFGIPNQLYYYGFVDDKSRDAAHKKWKEWLDKKPSVSTPR